MKAAYEEDFDSEGSVNIYSEVFRRRLICYRLRLPKTIGYTLPWDALESVIVGDEVWVWIVANGKSREIKDRLEAFPSDALMAQIREHTK